MVRTSASRRFRRLVWAGGVVLFCLCVSVHLAITLYWGLSGTRPAVRVEPRAYRNVLGDMEPRLVVTDREIAGLPYTVTTNAQGLRGQRPVAQAKPAGTLRVLCLGDSFTYGVGVDDIYAYPQLLEKVLQKRLPGRKVEVVNAGVPFYDIFDELSYFREKGVRLAADVVVLQFFINDLEAMAGSFFREDLLARQGGQYNALEQFIGYETVERRINAWFQAHFPALPRLLEIPAPSAGPSRADTGQFGDYHVRPTDAERALLRDRKRMLTADPAVAGSRLWRNYRRALLTLRDEVVGTGAKFLFVIAPDVAQVREDLNQPALALVPFCREHGIPVIDMARQLRAMSGERTDRFYLLPVNGHLNAQGNTLMATAVADAIHVTPTAAGMDVRIAPDREPFAYADPIRLDLDFGPGGVLPAQNGPVRITTVRCVNLVPWAVEINDGRNRIFGLRPDTTRDPVGDLVLRITSEKPLAQVSLTLFRRLTPPINGYVQLAWSRHDGDYVQALLATEKDAVGPEAFEAGRLAEIDLRDAPAHEVYLRLRLRNEARIFKEALRPAWRRFEVDCYPAEESPSRPVSSAATDRPASPDGRAPAPD